MHLFTTPSSTDMEREEKEKEDGNNKSVQLPSSSTRLSGYDFTNYAKSFRFGTKDTNTVSLDLSLANLFQKLTVECRGILANPQWKHYRHMQLLKKDQIRLSNGIWRSWHVQFQKGRKPLFCKFEIDPDEDMESHRCPQSCVIEGKYWKRTSNAVADEYRKWRLFYKQRNQWSDIKRLPRGGASFQQPEGGVQAMQVDLSDNNRLSSLLQGLEEFPDVSYFLNIPRPGDERTYMRPLVQTAEMMQPNLEMLNPSLDELLDKLEPMEVIFPPFNAPRGPLLNQSLFMPVAPPTNQYPIPSPQATPPRAPQYENQSSGIQYGNQSLFVTPPSKPVQISPQNITDITSGGPYQGVEFRMSPSAFLNAPHAQEVRVQNDTAMDIGTPPTFPSGPLKSADTASFKTASLYPSQATPTNFTAQATPTNFIAQAAPNNYSSQTTPNNYPSQTTPTNFQSEDLTAMIYQTPCPPQTTPPATPLYNYAPSTGLSYAPPTLPPPPSGFNEGMADSTYKAPPTNDPNMEFIAQQMKRLEEQQLEQLREIEKQQSIATQQYLRLLQRYITDSHSEQQQKELAAVLSDPSSVQILKSILTHDEGTTPPSHTSPPMTTPPLISVKKELESPQQSSNNLLGLVQAESVTTPTLPHPTSPLQLVKDSSMSDFQSRLVRAAAAQASDPSPFSASSLMSTDLGSSTVKMQLLSDEQSSSGDISPALMKKFKNARNLTPDEKRVYQELRRQSHISAEQKRRGSIKSGFEHLQSLVINPSHHPSGKVSKAVLLEKTIDYLQRKHTERDNREKRIEKLKAEIRQLNQSITTCQQQLPISGVPVTSRQRFEENRQLFKEYIQQRTNQNYKFWIYSIILQHLFESYNNTVSTVSPEVLCQSVLTWYEQNCSLPSLRPIVMSSLKELSVKTSILSDPSKLPEQLTQYATKK